MSDNPRTGPCSDLRVLDLGQGYGALPGMILADYGADVVKVERPGGDRARKLGPFPGDEPRVRVLRPDIVYTEITGYGPDGPYAGRSAYDLVMQGESGLMSVTGTAEEPARVGVSVCDLAAGSYAAAATLAALLRRERTGAGERVSVSLFDVSLDWLGYFPHVWWHRGETPPRTGMRHPHFCPYGPYPAGDGRLVGLAVLSESHWRAFCLEVLAQPDLYDDARFSTNEGRAARRDELEPVLEGLLAARPAAEWLERLRAAAVPCGAVNDLAGVLSHPQLEHNRLVAEVDSPVGALPSVGNPFLVGGERPALAPVPALGEHTDEVLREIGVEPG